jgi:hypothetical protein
MDYADWFFAQKMYKNGLEIIQIPIQDYQHEFGKQKTLFSVIIQDPLK